MSPQSIASFHCPRYEELPSIDLYMDQVVQILSGTIRALYGAQEEVTRTMINNYVKHRILPAPVKKKYNREHLCYLLFICILKRLFSIGEINALLRMLEASLSMPQAYNTFAGILEETLCAVFAHQPLSSGEATSQSNDLDVLYSAAFAVSHKVYVQRALPVDAAPASSTN